uniref:Uncharacterized protein n=1 Tax=Arcella intermedia TaxID=1963864 RepID=A0A6B2LQD6_9EUKA
MSESWALFFLREASSSLFCSLFKSANMRSCLCSCLAESSCFFFKIELYSLSTDFFSSSNLCPYLSLKFFLVSTCLPQAAPSPSLVLVFLAVSSSSLFSLLVSLSASLFFLYSSSSFSLSFLSVSHFLLLFSLVSFL